MTELQSIPLSLLTPVFSIQAIKDQDKLISDLITETLIEGKDYGRIMERGSTKDKNFLLKPVYLRICTLYGVIPTYEIIDKETDNWIEYEWNKKEYDKDTRETKIVPMKSKGIYRYVIKCLLIKEHRTLAEGIGSASSFETKYCDRPRELENTIVKMAKKRAFMDAASEAFPLSNDFCENIIKKKLLERNNQELLFNPKDPKHIKFLEGALEKEKLEKELWPEVIKRMEGKTSISIGPIIQEVKVLASARKAVVNDKKTN